VDDAWRLAGYDHAGADPWLEARDAAMVELLYGCGLRVGELVGLDAVPGPDTQRQGRGWIDLQAGNGADQLVEFARHPKAVGVRHVLHDEPDIHFMLRPQFMAGVRLLSELKLTYDILIFPEHLPNTLRFVSQLSENQIFVVDHVAKPSIKTGNISPWKEQIRELAAHPNVYCKLSGMVTEANWPNHRTDDFRPFFDAVFEAFGPDRLMFGSDWPVCLVAEEYHRWLARVTPLIADFLEIACAHPS